jgi:hypothetical protein
MNDMSKQTEFAIPSPPAGSSSHRIPHSSLTTFRGPGLLGFEFTLPIGLSKLYWEHDRAILKGSLKMHLVAGGYRLDSNSRKTVGYEIDFSNMIKPNQ